MARIRTIKPEFPQSESMGRVSRDARLLFIMLWTLCDDSGRTRGNSRMLASLLFPYDDDAADLIDDWMHELEEAGCVVRYAAGGATYLQVCNWLNHQKIDKPSHSKVPEFTEASRIFSKPREHSSLDQGSRTKDQGREEDQTPAAAPKAPRFDPAKIDLPECVDREAWASWIAYRRKRRLTTAEDTAKAQLANLAEWSAAGHDANQIIKTSIANGWQGLFEPKQSGPVRQPNGVASDRLSAAGRATAEAAQRLLLNDEEQAA